MMRMLGVHLIAILGVAMGPNALAQNQIADPLPLAGRQKVHVIYMGGSDCPPCVAWRAFELPKLEKSEVFRSIKFDIVQKSIKSSVPSAFFLPEAVKPLKDLLDTASGGNGGSPQMAVVVDGKVFDYSFGALDTADFEKLILAAQGASGAIATKKPCVRRLKGWRCAPTDS